MPNYNQLFNQQNQFQNQLLNNFNQLSNQFLTALTGGYGQQQHQQRPPCPNNNCGQQQPPYNGGGFTQPPYNGGGGQPPITQRPTYPTVPTNRPPPPPPPPTENTEDLINEIFTRPPTDEESGSDLIDIRVDENEGKTRRKREDIVSEDEVGVDNRFGLGKYGFHHGCLTCLIQN